MHHKRLFRTYETKKIEIVEFAKNNLHLTQKQIAEHFSVHESVVRRTCKKYGIKSGTKVCYKVPEEKIHQIVQLYQENPTIKYSEIMKIVGVSDSVIKRVRKQYGLQHLGYQHLVGCNNKKHFVNKQKK